MRFTIDLFYFRLAEVEGLVDLLQKEPGPFKSPPLSPPDGITVRQANSLKQGEGTAPGTAAAAATAASAGGSSLRENSIGGDRHSIR